MTDRVVLVWKGQGSRDEVVMPVLPPPPDGLVRVMGLVGTASEYLEWVAPPGWEVAQVGHRRRPNAHVAVYGLLGVQAGWRPGIGYWNHPCWWTAQMADVHPDALRRPVRAPGSLVWPQPTPF